MGSIGSWRSSANMPEELKEAQPLVSHFPKTRPSSPAAFVKVKESPQRRRHAAVRLSAGEIPPGGRNEDVPDGGRPDDRPRALSEQSPLYKKTNKVRLNSPQMLPALTAYQEPLRQGGPFARAAPLSLKGTRLPPTIQLRQGPPFPHRGSWTSSFLSFSDLHHAEQRHHGGQVHGRAPLPVLMPGFARPPPAP